MWSGTGGQGVVWLARWQCYGAEIINQPVSRVNHTPVDDGQCDVRGVLYIYPGPLIHSPPMRSPINGIAPELCLSIEWRGILGLPDLPPDVEHHLCRQLGIGW